MRFPSGACGALFLGTPVKSLAEALYGFWLIADRRMLQIGEGARRSELI